jgi:hypothetical protein
VSVLRLVCIFVAVLANGHFSPWSCTKPQLLLLFAVANQEDVEQGGRYDARSAAINIWSHYWSTPAARHNPETLGTVHVHWGDENRIWCTETDAGFGLDDLLRELATLEQKALGHGHVWIEPLTEMHLRHRLTQVADVVHASQDGEQHWHVWPSLSLMRDILAMDAWSFPPLDGVVETPILRPDGSILHTPGYDASIHLLYVPSPGFRLLDIPHEPSSNDLRIARIMLEEPFEGFPFVDDAAKANALALLMAPTGYQWSSALSAH